MKLELWVHKCFDGSWHHTTAKQACGSWRNGLNNANTYLDAFGQEMKRRDHRIVRYADDILILCSSQSTAENELVKATQILEKDLKLIVNKRKTHIAHSDDGIKFLGVEIGSQYTRIQEKKLKGFKIKVKQLTKRNSGRHIQSVIAWLNPVIRSFANYFSIANGKKQFISLSQWIRRRLRAIQLKLWKKSSKLHRRLKQLGYQSPFKFINMNSWCNSASLLANYSMPNKWFDELKLFSMADVNTGWIAPSAYVKYR